jgi:outer membrane protein OmpU
MKPGGGDKIYPASGLSPLSGKRFPELWQSCTIYSLKHRRGLPPLAKTGGKERNDCHTQTGNRAGLTCEIEGKPMKKILFATTALVATAGVAAAEVTTSGAATFGVIKVGAANAELRSNIDLTFTGTTETDGGVTLKAIVNIDNFGGANGYSKNAAAGIDAGGSNTVISASSGALTFSFGDTDGARDANTTELHRLPGLNFELWSVGVDNVDDGAIARLDYAMGDFKVSLSWAGTDEAFGIGFSYDADLGSAKVALGFGYEDGNQGDAWAISVGTTFGAVSVRATYGDGTEAGAVDEWGISAQYAANGMSVGANYFESAGTENWTIFGTYGLGGGATLFAQYGERNSVDTTSLGVRFNF